MYHYLNKSSTEGVKAKIDTTILDNIIIGRVEPYIYAFSTETVPNYLKVGDTSRGVRVRLDEWRKIFPNLVQQYEHSAQIVDETIFRDFAVHTFLEREKGRVRLQQDTFADLPYYSREFFKEATTEDVNAAVSDAGFIWSEDRGGRGFRLHYCISSLAIQGYTNIRFVLRSLAA